MAVIAMLVFAALLGGVAAHGDHHGGGHRHTEVEAAPLAFNETYSLAFLYYTWASFCPHAALMKWNCNYCIDKTVVVVGTVYDRLTEAYGFVGYSKVNKTIIVAFRGSSTIPNWLADFDFLEVKFEGKKAKVHAGFYGCWKGLRDQVFNFTKGILAGPCPECTSVVATGHSLGAAISGLAAIDLSIEFPAARVSMLNFGMPRLGDRDFASLFPGYVPFSQRMVHYHDIVPHLPFIDLGYHHVATEVWQITNKTEHRYIVCNGSGEDPNCSDSVPTYEWNPNDHNTYMDVPRQTCK